MFPKLAVQLLLKRNFSKSYSIFTPSKMLAGEDEGLSSNRVVSVLELFAPTHLAESWDNSGLLVEPYTPRKITKILLTNDLTEDVALEANSEGCEMIISYHPPIFAPLKSVVQSSWKEKIVSFLLENRIYLYSPHTRWDSVRGGVNDWLTTAFSSFDSSPIFSGTDPEVGTGRLLRLNSAISLAEAVRNVKNLIGLPHVHVAVAKNKTMSAEIRTIAVCAGSGSSVVKTVTADLYLTGEMQHHNILDAVQKGTSVILTNHSNSERGFLRVFAPIFQELLDNQVDVVVSRRDKDPLVTV